MAESTSFSSDVVRSCADLVILTLPMNKAMHGYDTLVSMADVGDGQFRFKQGTLSPLLYRLEREGWIKAKRQTPPKGKKRKIYRITTQGKRIHKKHCQSWQQFTGSVNAILSDLINVSIDYRMRSRRP